VNQSIFDCTNLLVEVCYDASMEAGWWTVDPKDSPLIVPTKLCLIHSEISEAMEAHRKGLVDSKLPHRSGIEVELADACIRIFDLAGALGLDLGGALAEKLEYNQKRADHKPENRAKVGGKAY
jgi:NTP pyrophosphatase (non-canonical NTP hydrolase)